MERRFQEWIGHAASIAAGTASCVILCGDWRPECAAAFVFVILALRWLASGTRQASDYWVTGAYIAAASSMALANDGSGGFVAICHVASTAGASAFPHWSGMLLALLAAVALSSRRRPDILRQAC